MCGNHPHDHDHDDATPAPTPQPAVNQCVCPTMGICYCDKGDCSRCQCSTNQFCTCTGKYGKVTS
jgi:hypothetical protein